MQNELLQQIENTKKALLGLYESIDQEELNTVPHEGSWTPGQLSEHLEKSCRADLLYGRTAETQRDPAAMVGPIKDLFLDFTIKMQSPDFIYPRGDHYDKNEVLQVLQKRWSDISKAAASLDLNATCLDFEMPGSGHLTRFEWLSFFVIHTQRHLHQLRNMKAELGQCS